MKVQGDFLGLRAALWKHKLSFFFCTVKKQSHEWLLQYIFYILTCFLKSMMYQTKWLITHRQPELFFFGPWWAQQMTSSRHQCGQSMLFLWTKHCHCAFIFFFIKVQKHHLSKTRIQLCNICNILTLRSAKMSITTSCVLWPAGYLCKQAESRFGSKLFQTLMIFFVFIFLSKTNKSI